MSTWLVKWNPVRWMWPEYKELALKIKAGEKYTKSWDFSDVKANINDNVYVTKTGDLPCGIMARGRIISIPQYNESIKQWSVDIEFEKILFWQEEGLLLESDLRKNFPEQIWAPMGSGIEIKKEYVDTLNQLWDSGKFTIYKEGEDDNVLTNNNAISDIEEKIEEPFNGYINSYSSMLIDSKNIIFHGAPGTGKSYLAKVIAADIISDGHIDDYSLLTTEQKKQVEFVQFHPSYDYTDFVEGLRPTVNDDGSMGFELQDGVFKKFIGMARENYENSQKSTEAMEQEMSARKAMMDFFDSVEFEIDKFQTINGNEFYITSVDDKHVNISIPGNATIKQLRLNIDEVRRMLESGEKFDKIKDITNFFSKTFATQAYSYDFAIYKAIIAKKSVDTNMATKREKLKKYIFIIDEINRGEISKIFGELFFTIDPGYRGKAGEVSTQYANLHSDQAEKFYIPDNVYIIGTMNDIDRSVDSFDFAMRRRFRFIELKADDGQNMLTELGDNELKEEAIRRMNALNSAIANTEDLNENYQIGASYFLKLKTLNFDQLWTDYLQPLLQDYIQGIYGQDIAMKKFEEAYGYKKPDNGSADENTYN